MTRPRSKSEHLHSKNITNLHSTRPDCIFVRDYVIDCNIGVYAEEKGVTQKVRLTIDAALRSDVRASRDEMEEHLSSEAFFFLLL